MLTSLGVCPCVVMCTSSLWETQGESRGRARVLGAMQSSAYHVAEQ